MKKGFTLVEMIVVIMIIALLMLITIPNIQKVVGIVQKRGCESQVKLVDAAILQYMVDTDEVPTSLEELISKGLISERMSVLHGHESRNQLRLLIGKKP